MNRRLGYGSLLLAGLLAAASGALRGFRFDLYEAIIDRMNEHPERMVFPVSRGR